MHSQEAIKPSGGYLRSLRRVSAIRSLQSAAPTTQRQSTILDPPTIPMASRTPSPRLCQGSMVLDFSSRMLQAAVESPASPHPLQVARRTPSPQPQLFRRPSSQSQVTIAKNPSTIRRRGSRLSGSQGPCVPGESGLAEKHMPVRRGARRVEKQPQKHRKNQSTLHAHTEKYLHLMAQSVGNTTEQFRPPNSSLAGFVDKGSERGDGDLINASAPSKITLKLKALFRASWAAGSKTEALKLTPQAPDSEEGILLQRAQEDNHGLRLETIRLQEECARVEARCKRDIARMTARQEEELSHYQEDNLQLREAQDKDMVSMGIRAEFFEGGYNEQIKQLEAALVEERIKSSYHLAHHQHYKMMFNMECQARSSAAPSPVSTPAVLTEDSFWGALRDIQDSLYQISSHVETLDIRTQAWQHSESEAPIVATPALTSGPAVRNEVKTSAAEQINAASSAQDTSVNTLEPQQQKDSTNHSPTEGDAPRRADTVLFSSVEADDPSAEPQIADVLSSASTEKNGNKLRLLALRQLLPPICTSTAPSIMSDSAGSCPSTAHTSSTSELLNDVPCTTTELDLETGLTSSYEDSVAHVEDKIDSEDEDESEDETDPTRLLEFSISVSAIPFSPLTFTIEASSSIGYPTEPISPILSSCIRRISATPTLRRSRAFSFASSVSGNDNDDGEGDKGSHSGAEMQRYDQATGEDEEKDNEEGDEVVKDIEKLLLKAWEWDDNVPSLDLVDLRSV